MFKWRKFHCIFCVWQMFKMKIGKEGHSSSSRSRSGGSSCSVVVVVVVFHFKINVSSRTIKFFFLFLRHFFYSFLFFFLFIYLLARLQMRWNMKSANFYTHFTTCSLTCARSFSWQVKNTYSISRSNSSSRRVVYSHSCS